MERFKKKLIWQIIPVLLVILIPAFCIGGYLACDEIVKMCLKEEQKELFYAASFLEAEIYDNQNYDWLLTYWSENAQEIARDIVYDSPEALEEAKREFVSLNPGMEDDTLTASQLEALDDESKALYARIELMDMTMYFNRMKEIYGLKYIYMVKILSYDEEQFIVSGAVEGESRGDGPKDIYMIGHRTSPAFEYHPVMEKIYLNHTRVDELEEKKEEGRTGYDYNEYVPIFTEDGSTYIISFCQYADSITDRVVARVYYTVISFIVILIIGTALMIVAFYKVLLSPISLLQKQIRKFTEDKIDTELVEALKEIRNENEIGQLSKDVSELAVELTSHTLEVSKLSAENERIETELGLARKIQMAALPKEVPVFENNAFEIAAKIRPAKEVGGDFFDYFKLDDSHMAIIIADVSGKGVPAAMFMMLSHICIKNMCKNYTDPSEIMMQVNELLLERNEAEMFVTVWFGILDVNSGEIKCVNAGHENPAICRADDSYEMHVTKHGFILAGMKGIRYRTETIQLNKGDTIFLYTDGVTEATSGDKKLYGTDRMVAALEKAKNGSCEEIIDAVTKDIDEFVGVAPQFDDFTTVCLRYL